MYWENSKFTNFSIIGPSKVIVILYILNTIIKTKYFIVILILTLIIMTDMLQFLNLKEFLKFRYL